MRWFKHDSDASADAKLKRVRMKYGMAGYGLYWYCLELIAMGVEANKLTFELEHDAEIIAHDTGINYAVVQEMMVYMCDLGLFENTDGRITCLKMASRLDQSMTSNPAMRKVISGIKNHDPVMMASSEPVTESCKNRREEKRVEEKREDKGQKRKRFTPPAVGEVVAYVAEKNLTVDPRHFHEYFTEGNWHDSKGNPVKNWKQKILTWNGKDKQNENRPRSNTGQNRQSKADAIREATFSDNW